ncbi:hypothetical protein Tco_0902896 [Tanacetum coccineum]
MIDLRADIESKYILFVALLDIESVRDLPVGPKCPVFYKHVQPITVKKSDTRHAKPKDTNSTKVGNNNSGAKTTANAVETALSDTVYSKGDMPHVNVGNNKDVNLDNEDSNSDVIENTNETSSFRDPKIFKVTSSSMSGDESEKSSLYEHWKETYDDNLYNDDKCEDLTPQQVAFFDLLI